LDENWIRIEISTNLSKECQSPRRHIEVPYLRILQISNLSFKPPLFLDEELIRPLFLDEEINTKTPIF
jgi:hypothetical protein